LDVGGVREGVGSAVYDVDGGFVGSVGTIDASLIEWPKDDDVFRCNNGRALDEDDDDSDRT
jgi:hypothetical protein